MAESRKLSPEEASDLLVERYPESRTFIKDVTETPDGALAIQYDREAMMAEIGDKVERVMEQDGVTEDEAVRSIMMRGAELTPLVDEVQRVYGCDWEEAIEMYFAGVRPEIPDAQYRRGSFS